MIWHCVLFPRVGKLTVDGRSILSCITLVVRNAIRLLHGPSQQLLSSPRVSIYQYGCSTGEGSLRTIRCYVWSDQIKFSVKATLIILFCDQKIGSYAYYPVWSWSRTTCSTHGYNGFSSSQASHLTLIKGQNWFCTLADTSISHSLEAVPHSGC